MHILVTGSKGFIGQNLVVELSSIQTYTVDTFNRGDSFEILESKLRKADAVIHLAGENRPSDSKDFEIGRIGLAFSKLVDIYTTVFSDCSTGQCQAKASTISVVVSQLIFARLESPVLR